MVSAPIEEGPAPAWLSDLRDSLETGSAYLAVMDHDRLSVFSLEKEWTRLGRSLSADIRFDDPTVSRRHALLVRQENGTRVLDDRSLNGVFVNGKRVESARLSDADEILVGRYAIHYVDLSATPY